MDAKQEISVWLTLETDHGFQSPFDFYCMLLLFYRFPYDR